MASNRRSQTVVDSSQWTQCRSRFVHCGGYFCGCRVHDYPFRSLGHSYGQSPFRIDAAQPRETSQNCFALLPDTAGISRGRQRPEETSLEFQTMVLSRVQYPNLEEDKLVYAHNTIYYNTKAANIAHERPSLLSYLASVDVKQHVYLLTHEHTVFDSYIIKCET